uniref:RRM domain-containing protein n=1 Tax=Setaria digitata TaxID=48799 RepID=A0A915PRX4_9BILA
MGVLTLEACHTKLSLGPCQRDITMFVTYRRVIVLGAVGDVIGVQCSALSTMSRRPGPPSIDGLYSLKIDNISYQTAPQDLRRLFEKYGEIGDIHIPRDRYTKQSKGFGFVRFYSRRDAEYAMDRMDGRWVDGREIRVAMARYERPIDERSRNGGGGGYRSGRRRPWFAAAAVAAAANHRDTV